MTFQWDVDPTYAKYSVVTHQWSGDLSIDELYQMCAERGRNSPMIWWPFNYYYDEYDIEISGRNSPMIWWPFNRTKQLKIYYKLVVTHQWSGDLSIVSDTDSILDNKS